MNSLGVTSTAQPIDLQQWMGTESVVVVGREEGRLAVLLWSDIKEKSRARLNAPSLSRALPWWRIGAYEAVYATGIV
jgi:hypothetical protein